MTKIPELSAACRLHTRIKNRKQATEAEEAECRALWLVATSKGATRTAIMESCGIGQSFLESELRKARAETDDPELAKTHFPHRGLTLGEFFCPEKGCDRSRGNGNLPFSSSQAVAMHRQKAHGFHLGENEMDEQIVRGLRAADEDVPTSELAAHFGVSYHAARSARSGRTWRWVT